MKALREVKYPIFGLTLFILFFIIPSVVFAQSQPCKVARPWYGSINCKQLDSFTDPQKYGDGQIFQCQVPNCEVSSLTQQVWQCPLGSIKHGLTIYDALQNNTLLNIDALGSGNVNFQPYTFHKPSQIKIDFWCEYIGGSRSNPQDSPQANIVYRPIKFELNYDSGHNYIENTEFCNINPVWNSYNTKQPNDPSKLQSIGSGLFSIIQGSNYGTSIPSVTSGFLTPKNLEADQGYWLVYDWVERPDLIIKYKDNVPVWCNVVDNSLTKFEKLDTQSGSCYYIPSERLPGNVECCSSDQCKTFYAEQNVQCTDDFKCGYTKSCLSDFDCGGVAKTCQLDSGKYYLVSSKCDKTKVDSYGKGKCISGKEEVKCCNGQDGGPNVCGGGKYCDYNTGCQIILQNCPTGKCCLSGGKYIAQSCSSNLRCCPTSDPTIGDCKTSCETTTTTPGQTTAVQKSSEPTQAQSDLGITGQASLFAESNGLVILIGAVAVIGVVGYLIWKKGIISVGTVSEPTAKSTKVAKENAKYCTGCGSKQKNGVKFCTKCGSKLK